MCIEFGLLVLAVVFVLQRNLQRCAEASSPYVFVYRMMHPKVLNETFLALHAVLNSSFERLCWNLYTTP